MRPIKIAHADLVATIIEEEIQSKPEGRYFHRLHIVLLLARGMTCQEAAKIFSEPVRTVQRWAKELNEGGLDALKDEHHPGRPTRLTPGQLLELESDLAKGPQEFGFTQGFWDGPLLSYHIGEKYGVDLKVRRCQVLFHQMGYALLRPRSKPAGASPQCREAFKKTAGRA
jgi:transposase